MCLLSSYDHAKPPSGIISVIITCCCFTEVSRLICGVRIVYPPRYSSDGGSSVDFCLGLFLISSYDHAKPLWGTSCEIITWCCFTEVSRLICRVRIIYPPRFSSDGGSTVDFAIGLCLFSSYDHAKPLWGTSCSMTPCSSFTQVSRLIRGPQIVYPLDILRMGVAQWSLL